MILSFPSLLEVAITVATAGALTSVGLSAQVQALQQPVPAFGGGTATSLDVETPTADNGCLAVTFATATGQFVVAGRGAGNWNALYEFDPTSGYTGRSALQPGAPSAWGIRDLANDSATGLVYGAAADRTVWEFDPVAFAFTGNSVTLQGQRARALAVASIDVGGQCTKCFVHKNWSSPVSYSDFVTGAPVVPDTPSFLDGVSGAAYDPGRNTIWWFGRLPAAASGALAFVEMDVATGQPTGQRFVGDRSLGGVSGGCDLYVDANGEAVIVYLTQSSVDTIATIGARAQRGSTATAPCGAAIGACGGAVVFTGGEAASGNAGFTVELRDAPGPDGTSAFLIYGPESLANPLNLGPTLQGCDILIGPMFDAVTAPALTAGSSAITLDLTGLNPGTVAHFQWLVAGPSLLPLAVSDLGSVFLTSR